MLVRDSRVWALPLALDRRPPPKKLELPSGAPKSWYLQAKTPAETLAWRMDLALASEPPSQAAY